MFFDNVDIPNVEKLSLFMALTWLVLLCLMSTLSMATCGTLWQGLENTAVS